MFDKETYKSNIVTRHAHVIEGNQFIMCYNLKVM